MATTSPIVDRFGHPISRDTLNEPQTAKVSALLRTFSSHPSRGLTPPRLARILQLAEQGDMTAQCELFEDMEEKDAHLMAEIGKRKRALQTLDYNIIAPRNATPEEASDAAMLSELVEDVPDFEDLLFNMMDAAGKGYSCNEFAGWERVENMMMPLGVEFRDPTWFQTDEDQETLMLRDNTARGQGLNPFGWIVHKHKAKSGYVSRSGLYRVLAWPYLFKNYAVRDLADFLEIYGLPMRLGMYPPGASDREKATLLRAVVNIGHDAAGIIPEGMKIEFKEAAKGAHDPFEAMLRWCEQSMSKAILGGTLTSQADGKTSTNALGNVHNEVRHDLLYSDARQVASTLTRDLLYPLLVLNSKRPVNPRRMPRFEFDTREPEDIKLFADALPGLVDAGMKIPRSWAHDKLRIPEPKDAEPILVRPTTPAATPPSIKPARAAAKADHSHEHPRDSLDDLTDDMLDDWQQVSAPILEAVQALCAECKTLEELKARLPELAGTIDTEALETMVMQGSFAARLLGRLGGDQ